MTTEEQIKAIMKNRFFSPKNFPKNFKITKNTCKPAPLHTQTEPNCWLFSWFNNVSLDHGIYIDEQKAIDFMTPFWIKINSWGSIAAWSMLLAEYMSDKNNDYVVYSLNVLTQTKIFAELLNAGRWFMYARDCAKEVLDDIKDNGKIDQIHTGKISPHAVNIWVVPKVWLRELGSRGKNSIYNDFMYDTPQLFIQLVRSWMIEPVVLFIAKRQ